MYAAVYIYVYAAVYIYMYAAVYMVNISYHSNSTVKVDKFIANSKLFTGPRQSLTSFRALKSF